jgi:hypothetical protein
MSRTTRIAFIALAMVAAFTGSATAQEPSLTERTGGVETRPCNLTPRKAARDLTGDEANKAYFYWGQTELRYDGPEVLVRVKRDYMVIDYVGGIYLQHRSPRLTVFGVFCYDRPIGVPYTSSPAREGCLSGVEQASTSEHIQWLVQNLGGRKSRWTANGTNFRYKARTRLLFTAPLDARVYLYDKRITVTPGYQVHSRNFVVICYPYEG